MKITSVRIKKNNSETNTTLLGIASVQFDNCLIIHDIKLIQLENKRIVSFPNKKVKKYTFNEDGYEENFEFTDIVHPSNKEFRDYIEEELYKIYDAEVGGINNEQNN